MRFLVDECVTMAVVHYLRKQEYDVIAVVEQLPSADDIDLLALAVAEDRVLITSDTDFGDLVFRAGYAHRGIVLLRLKDDHGANQVRVLASVLNHYTDQLVGHFTVIRDESLRVRLAF